VDSKILEAFVMGILHGQNGFSFHSDFLSKRAVLADSVVLPASLLLHTLKIMGGKQLS